LFQRWTTTHTPSGTTATKEPTLERRKLERVAEGTTEGDAAVGMMGGPAEPTIRNFGGALQVLVRAGAAAPAYVEEAADDEEGTYGEHGDEVRFEHGRPRGE
jgi:hypothetical protein